MLQYTQDTLDTGLTVIRVPISSVKSVTVLTLCNTGSRYESAEKQGIAHFFEHMPAKGTENYPSPQIFSQAVDGKGAEFNAYTGKEYTGYYVRAASGHLDFALDVVSDMVLVPLLKQEDIDKEKGVIIEELNMYRDMPARFIHELFDRMVFRHDGLGHDIIGNKKTIQSMQKEDFEQFLQQWYGLGNMLLIVAGDKEVLGKDSLLGEIEKAFSKGNALDRSKTKHTLESFFSKEPISKERLLVKNKETEQAHFTLAFPGLARGDKRRYSLGLLRTVLGGNMSSRLFDELREKRGLCYYISSSVSMYHGVGLFGAYAGVDRNRVGEAIELTLAEFYKLSKGERQITSEELERAKEYAIGNLVLGLEDTMSMAQYLGMKQLLQGEIESPEEMIKKIKAVSLESVNNLARELIVPEEVRLGLIGPFPNEAEFEGLI